MSKFTNEALQWANKHSSQSTLIDNVRSYTIGRYKNVTFKENSIFYKGKEAVFTADILGDKLPSLLCYMDGVSPNVVKVIFNFNDMEVEEELKTSFPVVTRSYRLGPNPYFREVINDHLFTNCKVQFDQMEALITLRNRFDNDDKIDPSKDLYRLVQYNLWEEGPIGEDAFEITISYKETGLLVKTGKLRKVSYLNLNGVEVDSITFWKLVELAAKSPQVIEIRSETPEGGVIPTLIKRRRWKKLLPKFLL